MNTIIYLKRGCNYLGRAINYIYGDLAAYKAQQYLNTNLEIRPGRDTSSLNQILLHSLRQLAFIQTHDIIN